MPCMKWKRLNSKQLGQYAEYYAKMEFASYGYDIYTSEVDDHGVDFLARNIQTEDIYRVQVKSLLRGSYTFIKKDKMKPCKNNLVCLLHFVEDELPKVYVIPVIVLENKGQDGNGKLFVSHDDYKKPEWGINCSKKNLSLLDEYSVEKYFKREMKML